MPKKPKPIVITPEPLEPTIRDAVMKYVAERFSKADMNDLMNGRGPILVADEHELHELAVRKAAARQRRADDDVKSLRRGSDDKVLGAADGGRDVGSAVITEEEFLEAQASAQACVLIVDTALFMLIMLLYGEKDIRVADRKILARIDGEVHNTFARLKKICAVLDSLFTPELIARLETTNIERPEGLRVKIGERDISTYHGAALAKAHSLASILNRVKPNEHDAAVRLRRAWLWNLREEVFAWTFAINMWTHINRIREETVRAIARNTTDKPSRGLNQSCLPRWQRGRSKPTPGAAAMPKAPRLAPRADP